MAVMRKVALLAAPVFPLTVSLDSAVLFSFVYKLEASSEAGSASRMAVPQLSAAGGIQGTRLCQAAAWEPSLRIHFSATSLILHLLFQRVYMQSTGFI